MDEAIKIEQINKAKAKRMKDNATNTGIGDAVTQPPLMEKPEYPPKSTATPSVHPAATTDEGMSLGIEEVKMLIAQKVQEMERKFEAQSEKDKAEKRQLEEALAASQLEKERQAQEYQDKLAKKEADAKKWLSVFSQFGYNADTTSDGANLGLGGGSPRYEERPSISNRSILYSGQDAWREAQKIYEQLPSSRAYDALTGKTTDSKDFREFDRFVTTNRQHVIDGLTAHMQKIGYLKGPIASTKDAPTTPGSVSPFYLEVLSSFMRQTHTSNHIHWQFANSEIRLGVNSSDTVRIARIAYLPTSGNPLDWELTPGIRLQSTDQDITANSVSLVLKEYGLGKASTTMRPVSIATFVTETAVEDILVALNRNLTYNYNQFEDLILRSLWATTSQVAYNDKNAITLVPGDVAATDNGTMTYEFLVNLYAYMSSLSIPAYSNGYYGLKLNPTALAQLKLSLAQKNLYMDASGMQDITNIFRAATNQSSLDKISGFEGTIGNFMIFSSNASGVGAPGAEGVQTSVLGAGSRTTRSSFAFGANTIARVTALPMGLHENADNDYGRLRSFTWRSVEAFGGLDIDPLRNPPLSDSEQLRVIEIRTTDVAV